MQGLKKIWEQTTAAIAEKMSQPTYDLWIKPLEVTDYDGDCLILTIESEFLRDVIMMRYKTMICEELSNVAGFEMNIDVRLANEKPNTEEKKVEDYISADIPSEEYTFENFIVGASNQHAHAACVAVSNNLGTAYNPLFIYGNTGLGKTHLLKAIQNKLHKTNPSVKVIYTNGEEFTTELISHIRANNQQEFKNKYRNVDVLIVDDIQFIAGKDSTQDEFFHTFNALFENHKQIILASDRPPKDMQFLEDRLRSRFESGIITDIDMPEYELKVAIIKMKAQLYGVTLSDDVTEYMAMKVKNNIRQLEGAIKKIKAFQLISNSPPTVALAQSAIRDIVNEQEPTPVIIDKVITEVSREFEIPEADIRSKKRTENITVARQISMYILREMTDLSLPEIGQQFGGRDHSTVHHAIKKIEDKVSESPLFEKRIKDVMKNVKSK